MFLNGNKRRGRCRSSSANGSRSRSRSVNNSQMSSNRANRVNRVISNDNTSNDNNGNRNVKNERMTRPLKNEKRSVYDESDDIKPKLRIVNENRVKRKNIQSRSRRIDAPATGVNPNASQSGSTGETSANSNQGTRNVNGTRNVYGTRKRQPLNLYDPVLRNRAVNVEAQGLYDLPVMYVIY